MRTLTFLIAFFSASAFAQEVKHSVSPPKGLVPDSELAIAIAVAVWNPIYGTAKIEGERPFKATLQDGVWLVEGSLPPGHVGGVAVAEISRQDGRVIRVSHGR